MSLVEYRKKRNFKKTREPQGGASRSHKPVFVIQEHWASHLHYDFRLEAFGVLKSWAVPRGPSNTPGDKRLAVEVEDHPLDYAKFEGDIPEGEYGAGTVKVWDHGTWNPPANLRKQLQEGRIEFELQGSKLQGSWLLQRTQKKSGSKNQWLLIKRTPKKQSSPSTVTLPQPARKAASFPTEIAPQLAQLVDRVPPGDRYIHEIKWDGYRTLAFRKNKSLTLRTRNGHDWTDKYSPLDQELQKLKATSFILDGEIVVLDEEGRSSFSKLQEALQNEDTEPLRYAVFDLLYVNGHDLRDQPLEVRKLYLKQLLKTAKSKSFFFSDHIRGQGEELLEKAAKEGLEGIISKDRTQAYHSGRSSAWQKIKVSKRQEFVIGGYTDPEGERQGLGALLMGVYENKKLRYVGRVGTGFNQNNIPTVMKSLSKLESDKNPFRISAPQGSRKIHWVKPKLVAEVEFKAWTDDQILRHASFQGLRADKASKEIRLETPQVSSKKETTAEAISRPSKNRFRITHPERLIYPDQNIRKIDVANYYKSVSPWLLPHLTDRPLSLLRCPDQAGAQCFFQKHVDLSLMPAIHEDLIRDQKVISIDSEEGLLQLIQWGVLEPHTWQCHLDNPLQPDQIVFDLDPDEKVSWKEVVRGALQLRDLLERLDLKSYLKTTGGKGLHLHVPISPEYSWESVKSFSKTVCQQLSDENPGKYTTKLLKKSRQGKIFLDYLRNGFGATAVAPYSLRSRKTPSVAVPIAWSELKDLSSGADFDLHTTLQRLAGLRKDPWAGFFTHAQKIKILKSQTIRH